MDAAQIKATHHGNKLGEGAKARKNIHGQKKVEVVMHEYKHGSLHSGSGSVVKSRPQAIAIAMHEAGMSHDKGFYGHMNVAKAGKHECISGKGKCGCEDRLA